MYIHSTFDKYLLSAYSMAGTSLDIGGTAGNKLGRVPAYMGIILKHIYYN